MTRVLADLRAKLEPFYSDIGRPSIDPELMLRMLDSLKALDPERPIREADSTRTWSLAVLDPISDIDRQICCDAQRRSIQCGRVGFIGLMAATV